VPGFSHEQFRSAIEVVGDFGKSDLSQPVDEHFLRLAQRRCQRSVDRLFDLSRITG